MIADHPDWDDDAYLETERSLLRRVPEIGAVVYFIASGPFVKVGTTTKLRWRLTKLRTSSPYGARLIGIAAGGRNLEVEMHDKLRTSHYRAEWFRVTPQLLRFVVKHGNWGSHGFPGDILAFAREKAA